MQIDAIDNSIYDEMRQVITWQYDNATNLIGVILIIQSFYDSAVKIPWDRYREHIFNIISADSFALSVWSVNLGFRRPNYVSEDNTLPISDDYFRRLLCGKMFLTASCYSMHDISRYLEIVYGNRITATDCNGSGIDGDNNIVSPYGSVSPCNIHFVASNSTLSEEESYLAYNDKESAFCHPAGVGMSFTFSQ